MIFPKVSPLFLSALAPLVAADFPVVPRSSEVLTTAGIKAWWLQRLGCAVAPHRRRLVEEIRAGRHDTAARLVCLSHNVDAWTRLGCPDKAAAAESKLVRLRERIARPRRPRTNPSR